MISTNSKRILAGFLICVLVSLGVSEAEAQPWRTDGTFYLKPKLGLNTYGGDWARSGSFFAGPPGPSTGLEVGYRSRLRSIEGTLGAYFLAGRYPAIARGASPDGGALVSELEQWRYTLGLVGQIGLAPKSRVNPYVQLGAGATVGNLGDDFRAAFSPIGGVGVDVALTEQVGVFAEATGILGLPDRGLDGTAGRDDRSVDGFGFFGAGVRINLGAPFTPVDVRGIDGPTRLRSGEPVTFAVRANEEEASGTVSYHWNFGDGSAPSEGPKAVHRFQTPGNYTLVLTGRNGDSVDRQRLAVTVTESVPAVASRGAVPAGAASSEEASGEASEPEEAASETTVRFPNEAGEQKAPSGEASTPATPPAAAAPGPEEAGDASLCDDLVELNAMYFEKNSDALNASGHTALEENVEVLEQCPSVSVRLDAYAAPDEQNAQQLAQARAQTVERFYQRNGIAEGRVVAGDLNVAARPPGKGVQLSALRRVVTVPVPIPSSADATVRSGDSP